MLDRALTNNNATQIVSGARGAWNDADMLEVTTHNLVLLDDAPESAGVRGADGLALVEDRRAAVQQRPVDDVRMAHHPADIARRPVGLARLRPHELRHGPLESHGV